MERVFVYGTLRKNERNHHLLKDCKCMAEQAWIYGTLYDTYNNYPTMTLHENDKVYGEIYEVSKSQLNQLDLLEDYVPGRKNNLYERVFRKVYTDIGEEEVFVYICNRPELLQEEVPYGDWKLYRMLKNPHQTVSYLAYGSCMDDDRFKLAKVDHYFNKVIGVGVLQGYSMKYLYSAQDGGRADILEDGGETEGILYELPFEAISYLFKREGFYSKCYRPTFVTVKADGKLHEDVLTFHVYEKKEESAPPIHYATEILRGSKGRVSEGYFKKLQLDLKRLGVEIDI
ncbi:gamma-glutamylcyclotransferase [Bacillus sp. 31A1R]|uniref:Gamma-glutamylcyclotransferase family protein n=1 Tax=Robertmurraya mangrovi TaxID=3098077 RepID=A0ABU5J4Z7_9BACI|nr:gamma-glutamylcyclotransferase [Bacillus sp. 31A1R]MDZ5474494.1 gamma-glutamylcyclotransferase [Bacillus sp. 31A1R]